MELAGGDFEQVQLAETVFVGRKCDRSAVLAEVEIFDVPWDICGQVTRRHCREIEIGEALEIGIAIGGEINSFAVFAEKCPAIKDLLARLLFRSDLLLFAAGDVNDIKIALVD